METIKTGRVVQYTRTVTDRISHVSIRTDRTDRQQGCTVCKECFTVRKSNLISGTYNIFMARETVCRSVRIERIDKRGIRSVKSVLRSVNRISLVGLRVFSWQEWSYTVCRSVRIERIDKRGIRSVKSVLHSVNRI